MSNERTVEVLRENWLDPDHGRSGPGCAVCRNYEFLDECVQCIYKEQADREREGEKKNNSNLGGKYV